MSDDTKKDLTRIEDLSEFLHEEDDTDLSAFEVHEETEPELDPPDTTSFEETSFESAEFEQPEDPIEEDFESNSDEFSFEHTEEQEESSFEEPPQFEENETQDFSFESNEEDPVVEEIVEEPIEELPQEEIIVEEPEVAIPPQPVFQETQEEVQEFAENINYGTMSDPGNPPFSVILKNIKFKEDVEDIIILLRDFALVNQDNEAEIKQSLENGQVLLSRLSEYSAIYLCNKLRRFDIDIELGLSEEIHPHKGTDSHKGLASKELLKLNKKDHREFPNQDFNLEDIQLSTTPTLEGQKIVKYLGLITEESYITEETHQEKDDFNYSENAQEMLNEIKSSINQLGSEDREIDLSKTIEHQDIYQELANRLKEKAFENNGNAVVGIQYMTTLLPKSESPQTAKIKITCTGSVVWASPA